MTIGFIALLLPVVILSVVAAREGVVLPSISDSYHHRYSKSFFIGAMCAFGAFLWSYQYSKSENRLGNAAAILATLVAIFPTSSLDPPPTEEVVGGLVHFLSAFLFFGTLAWFCFLWRGKSPGESTAPYTLSGVLILIAIAGAGGSKIVGYFILHSSPAVAVPFLLFEILAVEAFGYSWLYRGGVQRAAAGWAILTVALPILLIVFLPSDLEPKRLISAFLGFAAAGVLLAVLWNQRPGYGVNRYRPSQRDTVAP